MKRYSINFTKTVIYSKDIEAENLDHAWTICCELNDSEFDVSHGIYNENSLQIDEILGLDELIPLSFIKLEGNQL